MNRELLKMAWHSLRANTFRSALTASGITIGIFSVISVMTAISAIEKNIENGMSFLGANVFQFAKYPGTISISGDERFKNRPNIDYRNYLSFVRLMNGRAPTICPKVFDANVQAVFENRQTNPNLEICGSNEGFITVNSFTIRTGRNLSSDDVRSSRNVCVIGAAVVARLFPTEDGLGKTIRLDGKIYEVVGTLARKGTTFGVNEDNKVIIPITKFLENYGSSNRTITVAVQARNQTTYRQIMNYALGAFRQARGLGPGDPNNFELYGNDALTSGFRQVARSVSIGAFVLSSISLLAAGVGIMNVMLVAVTERTKEIGLRRSLGAKRSEIRLQFLFESLLLSLIGALGGIVLGAAAGNAVAGFLRSAFVFPWTWSMIGALICSAIGIAFGLYPAKKAASVDPIEALRFE